MEATNFMNLKKKTKYITFYFSETIYVLKRYIEV